MRQVFLLVVVVAMTLVPVRAQSPAGAGALAQRIAHTDLAAYRLLSAVHGGAGSMSFTALLNRGAVTPEFNFLHRGIIPAGAGIGSGRRSLATRRRAGGILDDLVLHRSRARSSRRGDSRSPP